MAAMWAYGITFIRTLLLFHLMTEIQSQSTTPTSNDNTIMLPPSITVNPGTNIIFATSSSPQQSGVITSIDLPCGAIGTPTPTYSWLQNGAPLLIDGTNIQQKSQGSIFIPSAVDTSQGYYQCIATNTWGTAVSVMSYVQLAQMFPFPSGSGSISTAQGNLMELPCNAPISIPNATYSWALAPSSTATVGIVPVTTSERIVIDQQGNLQFANVLTSDQTNGSSVYLCQIRNAFLRTSFDGSYTSLLVNPATPSPTAPTAVPTVSQSPTSAIAGQSVTLFCYFYGYPTPTVTWPTSLPSGRYSLTNNNTTLTISNVQISDANNPFTCQGKNSAGSKTVSISLNINVPPSFQSSPNILANRNVTDGQNVSFICQSQTDVYPSPKIVWYKNGLSLSTSSLPSKFSLSSDLTTLTISDVCKVCSDGSSDLMVIQCNISNSYGYAYGQGYLNVLDATKITSYPQNQTLGSSSLITFSCSASSDPSTPVSITWTLNGQNITYNTYIYTDSSGSLYINTNNAPNGGSQYVGTFVCEASNGYSSAFASAVLSPPIPVVQSAASFWYVFLILGLLLLLLLLFLCWFCRRENEGELYPVDKEEKKNGNDPVKELQDKDFHAFQRPDQVQQAQQLGNRNSWNSIQFGSEPNGSLAGYSNFDGGKFNEEGSFIGQYAGQPDPLKTPARLARVDDEGLDDQDRGYSSMDRHLDAPIVSATLGAPPDHYDNADLGAAAYYGNSRNLDGTRSPEIVNERWQDAPYDQSQYPNGYNPDNRSVHSPDVRESASTALGGPPDVASSDGIIPPAIPSRPRRRSPLDLRTPNAYYPGEGPPGLTAELTITGPAGNQFVISRDGNLNQNGQEYLQEQHQLEDLNGGVHSSLHSLHSIHHSLNDLGDASVV